MTLPCKGKSTGCQEFHPSVCIDLLKGECIGKDCTKGFHLFSLRKRAKQQREDEESDDEKKAKMEKEIKEKLERERKDKEEKERKEKLENEERKNKDRNEREYNERMRMEAGVPSSFLETLTATLKGIQAVQDRHQEQLMELLKNQKSSQMEWRRWGPN